VDEIDEIDEIAILQEVDCKCLDCRALPHDSQPSTSVEIVEAHV